LAQILICVVSTGAATPDLSAQTLQDYQLLRVDSEAEALSRSGANAFLWLSSAGRLAPQALEECLWALQSADWVTWKDTGAAPMPSLKGIAGPLGISRRVMASPDPKPGGLVRRLPWACVVGPAEMHAEESIPEGMGSRRYGAELDRRGQWMGRLVAHVENSGLLSAARWSADPVGTASMVVPVTLKEWVNRSAGQEVFDLATYQRFQPGTTYSHGRLLRPLRYAVASNGGRKRIAIMVPHLGAGASSTALLDLVGQIDRRDNEVIVVVETSVDNRWKERWMRLSDRIFELGRLVESADVECAVLSLVTNWGVDALIVSEASAGYRALNGIRSHLPEVRMADMVLGAAGEGLAVDLPMDIVDSLDFRLVDSEAGLRRLAPMAFGGQWLWMIRGGVELPRLGPPKEARQRLAVGFLGALAESSGADWLPLIAGEVARLRGRAKTDWLITGSGPLEVGLRNLMRRFDAQFFRDEVNLSAFFERVDVMVVLSESPNGDRTTLEAFSRGCPVVAVEADGRNELVADNCGVLVTGGHDGELRVAQALADLLDLPEKLVAMGMAGRERVLEFYSLGELRRRYQDFLRELLSAEPTVSRSLSGPGA
jgi:glycosyltransferase involved in cell wall biosynthesis